MSNFATIREAARRTCLTEYRLRNMAREGKLPGFKAGSRFYVNLDVLGEMLDAESRRNAAGQEATV